MQCAMVVGYLVPHRCENEALATCIQCGRMYCDEHVKIIESGLVCLACQQGQNQPVLVPQLVQDYTPEDLAIFAAASAGDRSSDLSLEDETFTDLS